MTPLVARDTISTNGTAASSSSSSAVGDQRQASRPAQHAAAHHALGCGLGRAVERDGEAARNRELGVQRALPLKAMKVPSNSATRVPLHST